MKTARTSLLILSLVVAILPFQALTCKETSSYKKAVQACYDLSVGVNASVQVTMTLNKQGKLNNQDYLVILDLEKSLVLSNEEFRKLLSSVGEINTTNKQAFIALVDSLAQSAANLQSQGLLRIKNPDSQAMFAATLATIRVSLTVIKGFLDQVSLPQPISKELKALMLPPVSKDYSNIVSMKDEEK